MSLAYIVSQISTLFDEMDGVQASSWQVAKVAAFRKQRPLLVRDLDFCFEVLAGKHKLGFTVYDNGTEPYLLFPAETIRKLYELMIDRTNNDKSDYAVDIACSLLPREHRDFFIKLFNREYRLGYSNRRNMVSNLHCMLAKTYPAGVTEPKEYYIQEKLNGNRCIAYYDFGQEKWRYTSRSQKEKFYPFDMGHLDKQLVYDGEVMSRGAMGNRDFATTSGLANSKYGDKSSLVYIIYDILDSSISYEERLEILDSFLPDPMELTPPERLVLDKTNISNNVALLPPITKLMVYPIKDDAGVNKHLDRILQIITDAGGEGVMLRDPDAGYYHSSGSGDRKNYLLKYKKLKTCDLRIIGWNEGKGKYEGMIGSFICEDDDHTVQVNVAGIDDDTRASDPELWIGKIIEIAYFESSQSKSKSKASLQFPRYKRYRPDKTETSL